MTKYSLKRRAIAVVMGVLFLFLQFLEPVHSQTSLNGCFTTAANAQQCARDGLISPSSAANAFRGAIVNPNPTNPFFSGTLPSKEAVALVGGVAALGYLGSQNMKNLQDQAISQSPADYSSCGLWFPIFPSGEVSSIMMATRQQAENYARLALGNYSSNLAAPSPSCQGTPATPSQAAQGLTDSQIYAEAAAAAAVAARDFAGKKDVVGAQTAAAAAAGAAGLVNGDPSATQADKDKANGAAAAAAAAAADAADPTKAPTTPQNPRV